MPGPLQSLSRRQVLLLGSSALAGGQLLRPSWFRESFDTGPSVPVAEWHLPGRTPRRQGYVPVDGSDALSVAWEAAFEAEAGYSLTIADGTVVAPTRDTGLHAFGTDDGQRRWEYTPDTRRSGGVVVAADHLCWPTYEALRVLDRDGRPAWQLPDVENLTIHWLLDPTLLPVGSVLFLHGEGGLEARDAASGLPHWQTLDDVGPVAYGDGTLFCSDTRLDAVRHSAYDPTDGSRLWQTPEYEYLHRGSATVTDTLLAYGGSDGSGRVQAFDVNDGSLQWEVEVDARLYDATLTVSTAVLTGLDGDLYAFDVSSGERRWHRGDLGDVGGTVRTEDRLYVHRPTGVDVLDPETGERRGSVDLAGGEPHALAYGSGRLFALTNARLYALEVGDGA
ncbi:outer membrane protein assembly factor BamB family protein [Haloarchaeobius amylolyticus]|uniref:outer membrane protein assembly factor BamB family protein n=1 Tax=Haloarchaeobius amylolyticus TaxID=1198296 RepID=UPI002271FC4F|nr:PQQ-binding-like beta-propeller repeat protein [Haloarchaeobius amylolyticus]